MSNEPKLSERLRALASTVHTVELIEPLREMAAQAEAHNVANETGMTPRELLAKLREAERLLGDLHEHGMQEAIHGRAFPEDIMQPLYMHISTLTLPADEH